LRSKPLKPRDVANKANLVSLSVLVVLFPAMDAGMKIGEAPPSITATGELGFQANLSARARLDTRDGNGPIRHTRIKRIRRDIADRLSGWSDRRAAPAWLTDRDAPAFRRISRRLGMGWIVAPLCESKSELARATKNVRSP
jgi:hypothetical protein